MPVRKMNGVLRAASAAATDRLVWLALPRLTSRTAKSNAPPSFSAAMAASALAEAGDLGRAGAFQNVLEIEGDQEFVFQHQTAPARLCVRQVSRLQFQNGTFRLSYGLKRAAFK